MRASDEEGLTMGQVATCYEVCHCSKGGCTSPSCPLRNVLDRFKRRPCIERRSAASLDLPPEDGEPVEPPGGHDLGGKKRANAPK
jgi:hypothetical protein